MKKLFFFILLFSSSLSAQVGGAHVYNFLQLPTAARQAALGGEVITLTDNVNQPLWNPATINPGLDRHLSVNYMNYLADIHMTSLSYAHLIDRHLGTLHTGINYLNYGRLIEADEHGIETGTFKAYDLAFSLGYAHHFPQLNLRFGLNIKWINSIIGSYKSFGLATDIGFLYHNKYRPYTFSLLVRNAGFQLSAYDQTKEPIPLDVQFGASYALEHVPLIWYITLDNLHRWKLAYSNPSNSTTSLEDGSVTQERISFLDNAFRHISLGAELFPNKAFSLRLGYNYRRARELMLYDKRTFAGLTAGFGIRFSKWTFNYAYAKYHPASSASTFSLSINPE